MVLLNTFEYRFLFKRRFVNTAHVAVKRAVNLLKYLNPL